MRMRLYIIILVSLLPLLIEFFLIPPKIIYASEIIQGQKHFFNGDYRKAIESFKKAIENKPNKPMAHFFLGQAYFQAKDFKKAKESFLKTLDLKPDYDNARLNLARCCYELREFQCAYEHFQYIKKNKPEELESSDIVMMDELDNLAVETSGGTDLAVATTSRTDTAAPKIIITSPLLTRGIYVTKKEKTAQIRGVVVDESAVEWVKVNGIGVPFDDEGLFSFKVTLQRGDNRITVEALDEFSNQAKLLFVLRRDGEQLGSNTAGKHEQQTGIIPSQEFNRYAVIIGISKYKDRRIPPLQFAAADAQGVYSTLIDPNYGRFKKKNVKLLVDNEATTVSIKKAIGTWLKRKAKKNDSVIIYFAGHGAPEYDKTYWVTHNADITDLYSTSLSNLEISDMLNRVKAKSVVSFLDSCYSAATVNRGWNVRDILVKDPFQEFKGKGRVTITSSDGKEQSLELTQFSHGVFTYYLINAMRGKADQNIDGYVLLDEIWDYVKDKVTNTALEYGISQTPMIDGKFSSGIFMSFNPSKTSKN
ncbi:MAG: caspase family protein [Desulfobacterales bacterium]|nr:MAG: caspase family protein [Desulfobacterales bacterium]